MTMEMLDKVTGGNYVFYPEPRTTRATTEPRFVQEMPAVSLDGRPIEKIDPFIIKYPINNTTRA